MVVGGGRVRPCYEVTCGAPPQKEDVSMAQREADAEARFQELMRELDDEEKAKAKVKKGTPAAAAPTAVAVGPAGKKKGMYVWGIRVGFIGVYY